MKNTRPDFDVKQLHVIDIMVPNSSVHCPAGFLQSEIESTEAECSFSLMAAPAQNALKADLKIWIHTQSRIVQSEAEGHFHLQFYFIFGQLEEWLGPEDREGRPIHPDLQLTLAGLSYSTARGLLVSRCQGTPFQKFLLPIVNPEDLLETGRRSARSKLKKR